MKPFKYAVIIAGAYCLSAYGWSPDSQSYLYGEQTTRSQLASQAALLIQPNQNTIEGQAFISETVEKAVRNIRTTWGHFNKLAVGDVNQMAISAAFTIIRAKVVQQMSPVLQTATTEKVANDCMDNLHTYIEVNGHAGSMANCITGPQCRNWGCDMAIDRINVHRNGL